MWIILFILTLFIAFLLGIFFLNHHSDKTLMDILSVVKYELTYNILGFFALIEDIIFKWSNVNDLPLKKGRVAVITGGSRGIGFEVVRALLKCEIEVIIGCRNTKFGEDVASELNKEHPSAPKIKVYALDVGSLKSVRDFCQIVSSRHPKINYLINNAGIMLVPFKETEDGFESQFAVNYLGHFLLTHLLLPNIEAGGAQDGSNARIVNVSSATHTYIDNINFDDINFKKNYIASAAYAQSKLAQVYFTVYLDRMLKERNVPVQVHAVHPGVVNTELFNGTQLKKLAPWMPGLFFKNVEQGALPLLYCVLSDKLENNSGNYVSNCRVSRMHSLATNVAFQEKLFKMSCEFVNIKEFGKTY